MKARKRICLAIALLCAMALESIGFASAGPLAAKAPSPRKITVSPVVCRIEKGETLQLVALVEPLGASKSVRWLTNDRRIAEVDQKGLVKAKKTGTFKIKVSSRVKPSIYKILTMKVKDTKTVTGVVIENDGSALLVGTSLTLTARVLPATASQEVTWESDKPEVADVSPAGVVTGYALGSATITVRAGKKSAQQRVMVLDVGPVSTLPAQVTFSIPEAIRENLAKIDEIKRFALAQIDQLNVTNSEKTSRRKTIENAFTMASIPWLSNRPVRYWQGTSRYAANTVYYGLPYTQRNRTFNVSKSLRTGAFKKLPGDEFYTAQLKDVYYPGNDCSSFVSMSIWGTGSSYSYLRSRNIIKYTVYKTIATKTSTSGYQKLRPGDLFVRDGHVAMFLYFTDSCRSRVMIIQQGGLNTLNTVACTIKPLSYYSGDKRYMARRRKSYA